MKSSDLIAAFLMEALEKQDGALELQRNELAQQFNVVPSQINYVISSRFTPERGYIIESRRGGGGYIRIQRVRSDKRTHIMHVVNAVGKNINAFNADLFLRNMMDYGYPSAGEVRLIRAAVSENSLSALPPAVRDFVRADIFKNMLISAAAE
ncbi:MAG: CtsR family transcriptional regulator [Clostridia bacterium]|nr:CtsR family transcriptional regulator [Clostridia bacterium]